MKIATATVVTCYQRDSQAGMDKFYRTYAVGSNLVYQWGRRGTTGQFKVQAVNLSSDAMALQQGAQQINAKTRKGYSDVESHTVTIDLDKISFDANGCQRLSHLYESQVRSKHVPEDGARGVRTHVTVGQKVEVDKLEILADRIADAITLSVTNPRKALAEYAALNTEWDEMQTAIDRTRSFLSTLDALVGAQ